MDFQQKFYNITNKNNSLLSVGLDLDREKIPRFLFETSNNSYFDFNKSIIDATKDLESFEFRVIAITRNGETIIPRGPERFQANDMVYVISNQTGIKNLMKYSGKKEFAIHNIMILGGSRMTSPFFKRYNFPSTISSANPSRTIMTCSASWRCGGK